MTNLKAITNSEKTTSLLEAMQRYRVNSATKLIESFNKQNEIFLSNYLLVRTDFKITATNIETKEATEIEIKSGNISDDQRSAATTRIWNEIKEFFLSNKEDIEGGKIKAADIGGAIFSITSEVILIILFPLIALNPAVKKVISVPFVQLSEQKGRYWGAAADQILEIAKGESALRIQEMAGTLASVFLIGKYLPGPGALLELGGIDGWNLTVKIGKFLGNIALDVINDIVEVVGGAGKAALDGIEDAFEAIF